MTVSREHVTAVPALLLCGDVPGAHRSVAWRPAVQLARARYDCFVADTCEFDGLLQGTGAGELTKNYDNCVTDKKIRNPNFFCRAENSSDSCRYLLVELYTALVI